MDEEKLDISVIEHFASGIDLDKKTKKKLLALFKYLAGGESPIEAVELTIRRDNNLREAQLKMIYEMAKIVENPPTLKSGSCDKKVMYSVLVSSELFNFVVRLLWIRIPDETIGSNNQPWNAVYFNSLVVLKHIITLPKYTQINQQQIVDSNTVEALLDFCDVDFDLLGLYPAVCALKTLTLLECEVCDRIVFLNGLPKLANLFLKDNCQKMIVKVYRSELTACKPYIKRILEDCSHQCSDNLKQAKLPSTADLPLNILRSWSFTIQMNAAIICLKIAEQNDRYRKLVLKDKTTSKALFKWLKTPAIASHDCTMIAVSLKVVAMLALNEELSWQMIYSNSLIACLEDGVILPENEPLTACLEVIEQLSTHSRCRDRVLDSKDILQALSRYIFSYNKEIQRLALCSIANLAESNEMAENLIRCGVTPKNVTLLSSFYQHTAIVQAQRIEKTLKRTCQKLWTQEEVAFGIQRFNFFTRMDEQVAQVLKDKGNKKFKLGLYDEAVQLYTDAINCVPQGTEVSEAGEGDRWMVLPAVLYSNRAQCHLNNENWITALSDCNEALARCLEGNKEAQKILVKTIYRRFRAYMKLGYQLRALNDVSFCLRRRVNILGNAHNILINYWEALTKYRESFGVEPIRRCGNCIGGEGDKLKRCANCVEVYCSRECQLLAWEMGHKNLCNK
ncbi:uncharacterized protein [Montipora capricornis]|uniref:uncharacterized protein n=1 Tax=Montipora capricornis TaxID=246305 RepID=UPI0035F11CD5